MLQSTTLDLVTLLLPDKSIFLFLHFLRLHNWSVCLFNMLGYWPISLPWSDPFPQIPVVAQSSLSLSDLFSQMLLFFSRSARPAPPGYKISLIIATL
jgi:hypothetical protein